ncbi:uncharacterized protein MELLADRAFT_105160 [Melampsora larici-populina 98AG31]|uniref:Secreted protein n=1 Tax=Melampsora larici-populina (strain 98AG31 / pathotype 3-4-7) TaxID=747676 RepID=F4RGT9_MELLP|nr:uncharacterized protein MELLADRAFT_105160 [Melampsora larici-populina 98AG31]EGG08197.1 secreted protein [Melampsora larici-populina 98AG31]
MKWFIFLGLVLQVLFVMGYPESNLRLEGRDSSGLESIHPKELSKRSTAPSNPVVCPGQEGKPFVYDLKVFGKMVTALISRPASCVYFSNLGMYVETLEGEPAMFHDSSPSMVRNYYGALISDNCQVTRPVKLKSNPPPSTDDHLVIMIIFYDTYSDSKQVMTCDKATEDDMRSV